MDFLIGLVSTTDYLLYVLFQPFAGKSYVIDTIYGPQRRMRLPVAALESLLRVGFVGDLGDFFIKLSGMRLFSGRLGWRPLGREAI